MVKKEGKGIWPLRNILDLQPDVVVLAGDLIYNDETINKEEICGTCGYFLNQFDAIECNNVEGCELRHSYSEYENLLQDETLARKYMKNFSVYIKKYQRCHTYIQ